MATDLAEFIGAALALNLLFGIPAVPRGFAHGGGGFRDTRVAAAGFQALEAVIAAMVEVIVVAFAFQMFYAEPEADRVLAVFTPGFAGTESVLSGGGHTRGHSHAARHLPALGAHAAQDRG